MKCEAAHALKLDKKAQLNISCPKHSQAFSLSDEVAEKEAAIHRQAMDMQVRNGYGIWLCTELCPFEGTASSITLYTFTSTPPLFLTSSEPLAAVQHVSTRSRAWPLHAGSALRWRSRRTCTPLAFMQDMHVFKASCQAMVAKTGDLEARAEAAEAQNAELLDFIEVRRPA